jgi:hypothetical protein
MRKYSQENRSCPHRPGNTNHLIHGMWKTSEYKAFLDAKQRCQNPNSKKWKDYGGRGIQMRFGSFEDFYEELGPRPEGMTLDRINTDDYDVGNVAGVTKRLSRTINVQIDFTNSCVFWNSSSLTCFCLLQALRKIW